MKTVMKNILALLVMTAIVASALPLFVNASNVQSELNYEIGGTHYTVIFEDELPQEQKEIVAKRLLGVDVETTESHGIMCTVFGHKYGDETPIDVITHKARASAPRCYRERYLVKVCSRCDDMVSTLKSHAYVFCCPEG